MKSIKLSIIFWIGLISICKGQEIIYQTNNDWKDIMATAQRENKFVFVDCYASWCIPCKEMDAKLFSQGAVATLHNALFINVKMQMDIKESTDKRLYSQVKQFEKEYNVDAYPTFLIFDPSGRLLQKETGSVLKIDLWNTKINNALQPNTQFYTQLEQYKQGDRSQEFLQRFSRLVVQYGKSNEVPKLADDLVQVFPERFTLDDINTLSRLINQKNVKIVAFIRSHLDEINNVVEQKHYGEKLLIYLAKLKVNEMFPGKKLNDENWKEVENLLKSSFPEVQDEALILIKVDLAKAAGNWEEWGKWQTTYYDAFPDQDLFWMNNVLWDIFIHCNDKKTLLKAASWSKRGFRWRKDKEQDDPVVVDTYANLLYKAGKKKEALKEEERMVEIARAEKNKRMTTEGNVNIEKMKKNLPTWQ